MSTLSVVLNQGAANQHEAADTGAGVSIGNGIPHPLAPVRGFGLIQG
jgi:hypothetical protein